MTVFLIAALIVFVIVTYQIITKLDEVMEYKFNYRFFHKKSLVIYTLIYIGLYCGYILFQEGVTNHSDTLNGILIMFFSICTFIYILVKNVRNTDSIWGVLLTFTQAMIYLPLSVLAIFFAIGMFAAYAQIRPVYIMK